MPRLAARTWNKVKCLMTSDSICVPFYFKQLFYFVMLHVISVASCWSPSSSHFRLKYLNFHYQVFLQTFSNLCICVVSQDNTLILTQWIISLCRWSQSFLLSFSYIFWVYYMKGICTNTLLLSHALLLQTDLFTAHALLLQTEPFTALFLQKDSEVQSTALSAK